MDSDLIARDSRSSLRRSTIVVGRTSEQVFLREELAASCAGSGRLVLLGGEAGIGKTTLAQDLAREARNRHCLTLSGHCYDLTNTPPYGPWLELFSAYPRDAVLPPLPAAVAGGRLDRVTDQAALFAGIREFFADLTATRPALVLMEDLHWADPASLELLRHLARQISRLPMLLVCTYRLDEPTRGQQFYRHLPALVREADGFRVDLRRLDVDALGALAAARYTLPDPDLARLTTYLHRHSEGNPFFATELLRTVEEERLLVMEDDEWKLDELDRVVVPPLLRQVIEGRLERLDDAVRRPLAIAAVIGHEVPLALWAKVASLDDEALLSVVEQAVETSLLAAERDGVHVRFVHALTRAALYEGILPPRRRQWHLQVAEALMSSEQPDPDAVAYHLQQAGDARAGEWLVRATDRAQRTYALLTAAERLQAAADLFERTPEQTHLRPRLLLRLGRLRRFSEPDSALAALGEAEHLARRHGDAILASEIHYVRGVVLTYLDRFQEGLDAMDTAAAALAAVPLEAARAASPTDPWVADALPETAPTDMSGEREAMALLHAAGMHCRRASQPMFQASIGWLEPAIALASRYIEVLAGASGAAGGVRSMCGFCFHGLGIAYASLGKPEAARQAWTRSREFFAEYSHHALTTFTLLDELQDVAMTYHADHPAERRLLAADAEAALARAGGAFHPGLSPRLAWLGCLVLDGQWAEADAILHDLPPPANAFLRRLVTAATTLLARHRGQPVIAWEEIHARFPAGPATHPGNHNLQEGLFLHRMAAELALDAGDLADARAWLTTHDAWLAWSGSVLGKADGHLTWARFHWTAGDVVQARFHLTKALALAREPHQPLVRLRAHRLLGQIETGAGNAAEAGTHLAASLDLAVACETPFERAETLLASAALAIARDDFGKATAALAGARQICLPLGATPALARADRLDAQLAASLGAGYPAGLTEREVDVLRLLAQRQTDKEIAAALFLSTRTVQTHVAHILTKLDVANRREAAAAASRIGIV